jgi:cation diffusion facilitator family transporter
MGFSSMANWLVSTMLFRVGKQTDSIALQADGWHLRTDVYTSLGVMIAMGVIWVGTAVAPAHAKLIRMADPVAAIAVALLILRTAWKLTIRAGRDLMDENLPSEEISWIYELLGGLGPRVRGFHRLRARKSGEARFIEFHLFVDPKMTVEDSHGLSHQVAGQIREHFPQSQVNVHVEPYKEPAEGSV